MLHLDRRTGQFRDELFREFPEMLRANDLVVFNNTRVLAARLFGRRAGLHAQPLSPANPAMKDYLHGRVEVLLAKQITSKPQTWECLVRPGRKIRTGERIFFGSEGEIPELTAEVISYGEF